MSKNEVTGHMSQYRKAKIMLWNGYFRSVISSLMGCSALDDFEEIDKLLFSGLVVKQFIDMPSKERSIYVEPVYNPDSSVMLGVRDGKNLLWQPQTSLGELLGCTFVFEELFEFDRYGEITLPFVKCVIKRTTSVALQSGTPVLLKFDQCRFFTDTI